MNDTQKNPFILFNSWYEEALKIDCREPTSMVLATATPDGRPSARVILLKGHDERGFVFYTNLTSRKGEELKENPYAALCFYWMQLGRQVRIEGKIERVTTKESEDYFATRARGSQLGAWASKQSMVMESGNELVDRMKEITDAFEGGPINCPPFWGGFRLIPQTMEFWIQGENRLHTRYVYHRSADNNDWTIERLYP